MLRDVSKNLAYKNNWKAIYLLQLPDGRNGVTGENVSVVKWCERELAIMMTLIWQMAVSEKATNLYNVMTLVNVQRQRNSLNQEIDFSTHFPMQMVASKLITRLSREEFHQQLKCRRQINLLRDAHIKSEMGDQMLMRRKILM